MAKITSIFGSPISENIFNVNFRFCKPGEQIEGKIWREWSPGTYSLKWNSTSWEQWFNNAVCEGGARISVNPEYWRKSYNSTTVITCINKNACKGGYVVNGDSPTQCATGYTGILCSKCEITKSSKYEQSGDFQWRKCPDPILNGIRVFGVGLAVFVYFFIIIIVNVRKTVESHVSILLRILTNYAQMITMTISLSSKYPTTLTDVLIPAQNIGESSQAFMSFDCFITNSEIKGPFASNSLFKLFLLNFLPIILFCIVALIWVIVHSVKKKWVKNMKRYLVISFISIIFLLHPILAQSGIGIFRCVKIDEGIMRSRVDTDISCFSYTHLKLCVLLGLPILIVWVISMPMIAIIMMYVNIKKGSDQNTDLHYFLILYQGLKTEHFYWEFVNSLRKTLILISFLMTEQYQFFFLMSLLIITWRIQHNIQPYKDNEYNNIEMLGINVSIITISSAMIYNSNKNVKGLNTAILILMISLNVKFILEWIYLILLTVNEKYAQAHNVRY